MLGFAPYTAERKAEWDAFVQNAKAPHFMHLRDYMDYHADRFEDASVLIYDGDKLVGLLPANVSQDVCYSHQGLTFGGVVQQAESMSASLMLAILDGLATFCRQVGVRKLIYKPPPHIYHRLPAQEDLYALHRMGGTLSRVEITTSIDLEHRGRVSSRRKRGAKKSAKAGLTFQQSKNWMTYWDVLEARLQEGHHTRAAHSIDEIKLLAGCFENNIRLFTAEQDGQILAGVVMFETPLVAHAQYIAGTRSGLDLGALDGLFEHLIEQYRGVKRYVDFGISTENQGRMLNEGLIRQKEEFGGSGVVHFVYTLDL